MAYIYNEKTGEFINTSNTRPESVSRPVPTRSVSTANRTTVSHRNNAGEGIKNFFSGLLGIALYISPYLILGLLGTMCS